eukprot:g29174.t1
MWRNIPSTCPRWVLEVVLRHVDQEASLVEAHLHKLEEHGFLNYFGTQRFGTQVIRGYHVGSALLSHDFPRAVRALPGRDLSHGQRTPTFWLKPHELSPSVWLHMAQLLFLDHEVSIIWVFIIFKFICFLRMVAVVETRGFIGCNLNLQLLRDESKTTETERRGDKAGQGLLDDVCASCHLRAKSEKPQRSDSSSLVDALLCGWSLPVMALGFRATSFDDAAKIVIQAQYPRARF